MSKNKEQQFYIETLHKDLEVIEKNRLKMYKEEEAERAKLLEDVIKIYEKVKLFEHYHTEIDKRLSNMAEKLIKMRGLIDKRPVSPKELPEYGGESMIVNTPRRGQGNNGSGERSFLDQNNSRIFTANTHALEKRQRKVYTSGRPSISQGFRMPNITENNSIGSMTNGWQHP